MSINLIVAHDAFLGIGINGELPWGKIKEDLHIFKKLTENNIVIMGRKTFDSLPFKKGLPNRTNIVITKSPIPEYKFGDPIYFNDLDKAIVYAKQCMDLDSRLKTFIIGGKTIYEQSFKYLDDTVYISTFYDTFKCDTYLSTDFYYNIKENMFFETFSKDIIDNIFKISIYKHITKI